MIRCRLQAWIRLGAVMLAAPVLLGGSCFGGGPPTDCYEMRTESGVTSDGEPCVCEIFFPSTDGSASGPVCHQRCQAGVRPIVCTLRDVATLAAGGESDPYRLS